jgi:uncharacterized membrane protein
MSKKDNPPDTTTKSPSVSEKEMLMEIIKDDPKSLINVLKGTKPKLKDEVFGQLLKAVSIQQKSVRHYSGPIPNADELKNYEKIKKGLADRIVTMAEKRQDHAQTMEKEHLSTSGELAKTELKVSERSSKRSTYSALFLATILLGLAGWLISLGHAGIGASLITANLVALVGIFITGIKSKKSLQYVDPEEKENKKSEEIAPTP